MNSDKIKKIEKMAEAYEMKAQAGSGAAFFVLPFVANLIRDKLIDTARNIPAAAGDLEKKFLALDKEAADAWFDSMGAGTYKKNKPTFDDFRKDVKDLTAAYTGVTSGQDVINNIAKFQSLMNDVYQKGSAARTLLDDVKTWATKTVEVAEDFGFSLGWHNSVRSTQDAIDRLFSEINKVTPEINKAKEEAEKKIKESPNVAGIQPTETVFEELSKVII